MCGVNIVLINQFFWVFIPGLSSARLPSRVPSAHMSTGPAGDGKENLIYVALVGAVCIGGGVYVSKQNTAKVTSVDACIHNVEELAGFLSWRILPVLHV